MTSSKDWIMYWIRAHAFQMFNISITFCFGCSFLKSSSTNLLPGTNNGTNIKSNSKDILRMYVKKKKEERKTWRKSRSHLVFGAALVRVHAQKVLEKLPEGVVLCGGVDFHRGPRLVLSWGQQGGVHHTLLPHEVPCQTKSSARSFTLTLQTGFFSSTWPVSTRCYRKCPTGNNSWQQMTETVESRWAVPTCCPKVASWVHFDFCNFVPELREVETDCSAQRHEGEQEQECEEAAVAHTREGESSHFCKTIQNRAACFRLSPLL